MIDQNQVSLLGLCNRADLRRLAAADEKPGVGALAPAADDCYRNDAGGARQLLEFLQVIGPERFAQAEAHQHRPLARPWAFKHTAVRSGALLGGGLRTVL